MLADFELEISPLLNDAKLLSLGAETAKTVQFGPSSSAVSGPGIFSLRGDRKPQSWSSSVDTVGTLTQYAHVTFEFTRKFQSSAFARRALQAVRHACKFNDRSLIANFRKGQTGVSTMRSLLLNQRSERRREFMKSVFVPT